MLESSSDPCSKTKVSAMEGISIGSELGFNSLFTHVAKLLVIEVHPIPVTGRDPSFAKASTWGLDVHALLESGQYSSAVRNCGQTKM